MITEPYSHMSIQPRFFLIHHFHDLSMRPAWTLDLAKQTLFALVLSHQGTSVHDHGVSCSPPPIGCPACAWFWASVPTDLNEYQGSVYAVYIFFHISTYYIHIRISRYDVFYLHHTSPMQYICHIVHHIYTQQDVIFTLRTLCSPQLNFLFFSAIGV